MYRALSFFNPTQWYILGGVLLALTVAFGAIGFKIHSSGVAVGEANKAAEISRMNQVVAEMKLQLKQTELEREQERVMLLNAHLNRVNDLTNELTEAKNAYEEVNRKRLAALNLAAERARRVRDLQATAELTASTTQALAVAECNVVRTFAAGAYRTATTCRNAVADLGLGAGGLVEASASAHYEHGRAEALMKFTMPAMPAGPFGERE